MAKTGTKEWSDHSNNFIFGCSHNCRYCFQKARMKQLKMITTDEQWGTPRLREKAFNKKPKKLDGRIMFPTTHDILPQFIEQTVIYLDKWLAVGNDILIVSKPHYKCIKTICEELEEYKDQIVFRFTIGSEDNKVLKFWEPNAPSFNERLRSLSYAYRNGWVTSVSCEPYLDDGIAYLVYAVLPFVNDSVWIGKMNNIVSRVDTTGWKPKDFKFLDMVKNSQTDEFIFKLYDEFFGENGVSPEVQKMIRWKDSIKRVLDLPEEEIG